MIGKVSEDKSRMGTWSIESQKWRVCHHSLILSWNLNWDIMKENIVCVCLCVSNNERQLTVHRQFYWQVICPIIMPNLKNGVYCCISAVWYKKPSGVHSCLFLAKSSKKEEMISSRATCHFLEIPTINTILRLFNVSWKITVAPQVKRNVEPIISLQHE